jgi:UDP-N-acetylglucosamine:LPS N-acetylglucosamine transferase
MPPNKRFLILTSDSGFGHRSAADSIAKALELRHPQDVLTSVVNPIIERPTSIILQKIELGYDRTVRDYPKLYRLAYELSDRRSASALIESTLKLTLHKNIQQLIHEMKPDGIISTNEMFSAPIGTALNVMKKRPPFFMVVTDLADVHSMWFNSKPDRFFVASELVRSKAIASGISPRKIFISGIPVAPFYASEHMPQSELRMKVGLDPQLTTLLVVGSQRVSGIYAHLEALEMVMHPFQVVVIAGGDNDLYEKINQHKWRFPILVKNYVNNMPEWMLCADLLITKAGGLILSEGLAAGVPIVLIDYLPGQEEGNVRFVIDHQVGAIAENPWDFSLLLDSWLRDQQRHLKAVAKNSRRLGRPDAAFVIADALWQAAEMGNQSIVPHSEFLALS